MKDLIAALTRRSFVALLIAIAAISSSAGAVWARWQQQPPLRHGELPFVSPDGQRIVFVRQLAPNQDEIYVISADGSGERRIGPAGEGPVRWTHDGRIYWSTSDWTQDTTHLMIAAPDGTPPAEFQRFVGRDASQMPDGDFIIATGKFPKQRPAHLPSGARTGHVFPVPVGAYFNNAVSPDGRQVAFTHADSGAQSQVWVMNTNGTGLRQLTHIRAEEGTPQWPSWSADGSTLAIQVGMYSRTDPGSNTSHIWLVDMATGRATKLAAHDRPYLDETPSYFPDGRRIAFQSDRTGRMEVWVMDVDGSGATQVTR